MNPGTRNDPIKTDWDLLISLSRASRVLKSCTSEDIKDTLLGLSVVLTRTSGEHGNTDGSHSNNLDGESSSTEFLVWLLQSHCKAVQYAAVKTLLALSDSLRRTRSAAWAPFLIRLFTAVKDWVSVPSLLCGQCLEANSSQSNSISHSHGMKKLWAALNAVHLLQRILKACLRNSGDEALQDLRTFLKLFMENIRMLTMSTVTKQDLSNCSQCLAKIETRAEEAIGDPTGLFLGSVLRLICTATLVTASNSHFKVDDNAVMTGHFLEVMETVIPAVSSPVLAHHINCGSSDSISPFLCHKLLMIMMRLSECFGARHSLALACFSSILSFGGQLFGFTLLTSSASEGGDSLADSPFLSSMARNSQKAFVAPSVKHLQRRALYILFKIASSVHQSPTSRIVTTQQDVVDNRKIEQDESICTRKQRVSQTLIDWLDLCLFPPLPLPTVAGSIQGCTFLDQLAKSFVEMYFDEDDLMLKMLILLASQPSILSFLTTTESPNNSGRWKLAVEALRPERLFHSFLVAIQFNSSVLLDFLISEESGSLSVLYLMRSVRWIIESWPEFVKSAPGNYLLDEEVNTLPATLRTRPSAVRKRKREGAITKNTSDSQGYGWKVDCYSPDRMGTPLKNSILRREAECLLQLKVSVERLHRRSLFPYNPSALLRRFDAILELLDKYLMDPEPTLNT